MVYYPDQRFASPLTIIRRECILPENVTGRVRVPIGEKVELRSIVAEGILPSRYIIIDAMEPLGLRKPDELPPLMQVELGDTVEDQDVLAGKNPSRGKRVFAPVRGRVLRLDNGRIIMQEMPQKVSVEAGVRGRVTQVQAGRSVTIEATGALVQGVWGNNRRTIAVLRMEPETGLLEIKGDILDSDYRGAVVVTQTALTAESLAVMERAELVGVIAPGMDIALMESAMMLNSAIMLTEGFGVSRMSRAVYNLFESFRGQQVTLDAYLPGRWETRYPEAIINVAARNKTPNRPNPMLALRKGTTVRVTSEPYAGQTGKIAELPTLPIQLANGLRVSCARVELSTGETVIIPLTNLEVLGR